MREAKHDTDYLKRVLEHYQLTERFNAWNSAT